ncbi:MAG: NADPH-dependent FMN reductase [Halobacteriota archaeon]
MERTHVVAVCGSLRDRSYTRTALEYALDGAESVGGTGEILDLRTYDLPVFDADHEKQGDSELVVDVIRDAGAILLGTPMYHGSFSGVLKNALDYCGFDEFGGKTVGLLGVAGGSFPITALEHLRSVCRSLNAWVLPHQAAIPRVSSAFRAVEDDATGASRAFVDEGVENRVLTLGRRVVEYANIEPDPRTFEATENVGADK